MQDKELGIAAHSEDYNLSLALHSERFLQTGRSLSIYFFRIKKKMKYHLCSKNSLLLDGNSENDVHAWIEIEISSFKAFAYILEKRSTGAVKFKKKMPVFLYTCTTCSVLPSIIRPMIRASI